MDCRHEFGAEEDCGETAMKIMKASPQVTLSAQLNEPDLKGLADDGVELVICNRPDDESADQASFSVIQQAAEALGMEAVSIAFKTGEMNHKHIESFSRLLNTGKKTHAYCRTGNRSFCLYAAFHASTGRPERGNHSAVERVRFRHRATHQALLCWECQYE